VTSKNPRATFGLFITNLHEAKDDLGQRLSEHREQIQLARDCGFTSLAAGQHFLTQPINMLATIPQLASVIDISGDMRLVPGVLLLPLLNPVFVAEEVASLDWLSGGRAVLGLGIGYRPEEFAAMGVSTHDRVKRFNECLAVIRAIWSADGSWSFEGEHFRYDPTPGGLKPKQQPHPPLWLATDVDAAVRRAGRLGASWYINPRAHLESLKPQLGIYEESLAAHGNPKPATFPIRREAFVASSDREAREMAVTYLKRMLAIYEAWGQYDIMPGADVKDRSFGADDIPDTYLVGTPERVAELIARYVDELGVNHFVLRMQWPGMPNASVMQSLELVGSRLIPQFA
jgi:alkanesulfonate monooxygenase SsuD/methylene tetrahydromethanopterin reductase-like flavin-dependent oxidoreductase (luciferase family)